ncbi:MAG TPA: c-type cytochrome [Xanthobacteraceae bacterium]|nr:c-type cytochrome [Xanthobacteraceae bacterium]
MIRAFAPMLAVLAASTSAAFSQSPVERGSYLVNSLMTCHNCHTPIGPNGPQFDRAFSGGLHFSDAAFEVTAANITPDPETGIGKWSADDIKKTLLTGVRPNGAPLAPAMPTAFYKVLTARDIDGIAAYLKSVKPIENKVAAPVYKVAMAREDVPGASQQMSEADFGDKVKHGFYLATIAHCMECHTPETGGRHDFSLLGKGGREFKGPWGVSVSRNLTSSKTAGLGGWSDAEIKRAITHGLDKDGSKLKPPMGFGFYAKMTDGDLDDVVAWLRTLPPKE